MRPKRYVHLEETEITTLREGHKNGQQYQFRNRCHCLILSHEGHDMATLKTIFQVSHPTITNWFDGWETNGIRGLMNQPGQGRKAILSADDQPLIKTKLQATPQQLKRVRDELKAELNKEFFAQNAHPFFKKFSQARWGRWRKSLKSKQDPVVYADKVACLSELQTLEKQKHIDIFYGDESGYSLNCVIPYCWQFPHEGVAVLAQRGKTLNVLGFMNSGGDKLQTFTKEGTINAEFVLSSIDKFVSSLTKLTVLVLDNARIHHAKIFQACLDKWEQAGLYIFYLPAYSPHLNRIERLWRESKYRWIPPQSYTDLATLSQTLDMIWSRFGTDYKIHFSDK